ncbi:tRNA uridine 5-carboxymethylaminomethyl modification protein, partial [Achromatium sp. WMS1]
QQRLRNLWIRPAKLPSELQQRFFASDVKDVRALELLKRSQINYATLMQLPDVGPGVADVSIGEQVEIQMRYEGYITRQREEIVRQRRHDTTPLPDNLDYTKVSGLSTEVREILSNSRPNTIGQAARLSGITPAAISLLLVYLKRRGVLGKGNNLDI